MSVKLPVAAEQNHRTKGLLRLTMACNERCSFCNVPVEDYPQPTPPLEEVLGELEVFVRSGQRSVTISGGEPTLYRDRLLTLVKAARDSGIGWVELQTNAVLIDDAYAAALAEAGVTGGFVSLLSHRPELHDELAGLDGAFADCVRGIEALCAHGIAVVVNPVVAFQTQHLVADYVDFVATELPGVNGISLSAVQPHGRAAHNLDLLPDYAVLAEEVPQARARAEAHGVNLLNPYCGLPLCIGWSDHAGSSVEAREAAARRRGVRDAGAPPGLDNSGNKSQGQPCTSCALRSRCGGAWHAYWEHRDGSGIHAPAPSLPPWAAGARAAALQTTIDARGGIDEAVLRELETAVTPARWVRVEQLGRGDGERLWHAGATDLALEVDGEDLLSASPLTRELRRIWRENRERPSQDALRVAALVGGCASHRRTFEALQTAAALGITRVGVRGAEAATWERFSAAVEDALPGLEVTLVEPG